MNSAPARFGPYQLLDLIGSGGMGEVFIALDPDGEPCVVKRMLEQHAGSAEFEEMFLAEGRLVQQLKHRGIAAVRNLGVFEGRPFIDMEYVPGVSLRSLLDVLKREGRRPPVRLALEIIVDLLDALHAAHEARGHDGRPLHVVHRDVNPFNVLIDFRGRTKLIDFGIAKTDESRLSASTGTIKGKFAYMSPEQSAAEVLDQRSDVFSAGILAYETLTLRNPFGRTNVVLSLEAIQTEGLPRLGAAFPDLAPLDPILSRALAKDPDRRTPTAGDLRDELEASRGAFPAPAQSLEEVVRHFFGPRLERARALLGDAAFAVALASVRPQPRPPSDPHDLASVAVPPSPTQGAAAPTAERASPRPEPRGRWTSAAGYALLLVLFVGIGFMVTEALLTR